MPWDKWFSTYHNGTEEDTQSTRARKKRMYSG
jgi:sterol desaturase/sphingolipid hydroxylase (fatty acid hydroxylase superfamily)